MTEVWVRTLRLCGNDFFYDRPNMFLTEKTLCNGDEIATCHIWSATYSKDVKYNEMFIRASDYTI